MGWRFGGLKGPGTKSLGRNGGGSREIMEKTIREESPESSERLGKQSPSGCMTQLWAVPNARTMTWQIVRNEGASESPE